MFLIEYIFLDRNESSGIRLFSNGRVELAVSESVGRPYSSINLETVAVYGLPSGSAISLEQKLNQSEFLRLKSDYFPSFMLMTDFYEELTLNYENLSKKVCCHGRRPESAVYENVADKLRKYVNICRHHHFQTRLIFKNEDNSLRL